MRSARLLVAVALLGLVLLAGCSAQSTSGHLTGKEVAEAPPDVEVIPAADDRIADVEAVQSVVEQAAERDGETATVEISGGEADRTIDRLRELPHYDGGSSEYRSGWYVEYRDHVVVVELAVQE